MQYRYATERENYADLSSGRVFYNQPGHPAFPVRLASEIFQRCLAYRRAAGLNTPCVMYDPCCGAAYHLGVLGYLHWSAISGIIASDVDAETTRFARQNLGLLSEAGIQRRMDEISAMIEQFGKDSHCQSLESAARLRQRIQALAQERALTTQVFQANATDGDELQKHLQGKQVDMVLSDVPYGQHSHWNDIAEGSGETPINRMLEALRRVLLPGGLAAIICDKSQKAIHPAFRRLEQFPAGKRRVVILKLT